MVGTEHCLQPISDKARQTEFTVYRHRPHGILKFPRIFHIS